MPQRISIVPEGLKHILCPQGEVGPTTMSHAQPTTHRRNDSIDPAPPRLGRRSFLTAAAASLAGTALARDYGPSAQPVRYPDPDIVVLDPRFAKYKIGNTPIQRLHTGMLWA